MFSNFQSRLIFIIFFIQKKGVEGIIKGFVKFLEGKV